MTASMVSASVVTPERRKDFLALLRESRAFWESMGAVVRVRTALVAGENSGRILTQQLFVDEMGRATALDKAAADAADNPINRAVNDGSFPASLVSRSWLNSVDPAAPIPADQPINAVLTFEITAGRLAEAQAAFDAADKRHRGLGVEPALWTSVSSGSATGRRVRAIGFASYAAQADFNRRNLALPAPPLNEAVAAGILRTVGAAVNVRLEGE